MADSLFYAHLSDDIGGLSKKLDTERGIKDKKGTFSNSTEYLSRAEQSARRFQRSSGAFLCRFLSKRGCCGYSARGPPRKSERNPTIFQIFGGIAMAGKLFCIVSPKKFSKPPIMSAVYRLLLASESDGRGFAHDPD